MLETVTQGFQRATARLRGVLEEAGYAGIELDSFEQKLDVGAGGGLERAIERLGHRPVRVGNPHALLGRAGKGELPSLDAALNLAEGFGGRNREAWAPVLLELAGGSTFLHVEEDNTTSTAQAATRKERRKTRRKKITARVTSSG